MIVENLQIVQCALDVELTFAVAVCGLSICKKSAFIAGRSDLIVEHAKAAGLQVQPPAEALSKQMRGLVHLAAKLGHIKFVENASCELLSDEDVRRFSLSALEMKRSPGVSIAGLKMPVNKTKTHVPPAVALRGRLQRLFQEGDVSRGQVKQR